jgi:integrase
MITIEQIEKAKRADLSRASHHLRPTMTTQLLSADAGLITTQNLLGHIPILMGEDILNRKKALIHFQGRVPQIMRLSDPRESTIG